jgi:hypothetical protein
MRKNKISFCVKRMVFIFRSYTNRIGRGRIERNRTKIRDVFSYSSTLMSDTAQVKSNLILRRFLTETSEIHTIRG